MQHQVYYDWEKLLKKWQQMRARGISTTEAASRLGVAHSTPYQWVQRIKSKKVKKK